MRASVRLHKTTSIYWLNKLESSLSRVGSRAVKCGQIAGEYTHTRPLLPLYYFRRVNSRVPHNHVAGNNLPLPESPHPLYSLTHPLYMAGLYMYSHKYNVPCVGKEKNVRTPHKSSPAVQLQLYNVFTPSIQLFFASESKCNESIAYINCVY